VPSLVSCTNDETLVNFIKQSTFQRVKVRTKGEDPSQHCMFFHKISALLFNSFKSGSEDWLVSFMTAAFLTKNSVSFLSGLSQLKQQSCYVWSR